MQETLSRVVRIETESQAKAFAGGTSHAAATASTAALQTPRCVWVVSAGSLLVFVG